MLTIKVSNQDNIDYMNKAEKDKYPPEYLFWRKRIEGQIRHTMYEHPEFFTQEAYGEKGLVDRMAKRLIGEIVAAIGRGDNSGECATQSAFSEIARRGGRSYCPGYDGWWNPYRQSYF